jgi:hypothetical protein
MALFQKGERPVGRAKGVLNKRTVEVRDVLMAAAREIGGLARLVAWIKEDALNERLFWATMYLRLLPLQVMGSGPHGELELNVRLTRDEMLRRLEERGLPTHFLDIDVPTLQVEGNGADLDAEQSNGDRDDVLAEGTH